MSEMQSNFKSALLALPFSCIFITATPLLIYVSALISTILYIHTQEMFFDGIECSIIFYCFPFKFYFKSLILYNSVSEFLVFHFYFLNFLSFSHVYLSPSKSSQILPDLFPYQSVLVILEFQCY